jgi:regulator of cell morphogenesis and NO signaling
MPTSTQSIREIVSKQQSAAGILLRFDIDLCSQADESLQQACSHLQLSVDQVLEKLSDAEDLERGVALADPTSLSLSRLIRHIVRVHHRCARQELPRLAAMAHTLAAMRSDRAPELKKVETLIDDLHADMLAHIQKEEQILFPFILQMDQDSIIAYRPTHSCFDSITRPVFMMVQEHEAAASLVEGLHRLTHGFQPPAWACATHIALYAGLRAFEADLKQHVHLENDVLFPRALAMETVLSHRG